MKTTNFEFLKENNKELYSTAQAAEASIYENPVESMLFCRALIENILSQMMSTYSIKSDNLVAANIIKQPAFKQCVVSSHILDLFNHIILATDVLSAPGAFSEQNALPLLHATKLISVWYILSCTQTSNLNNSVHASSLNGSPPDKSSIEGFSLDTSSLKNLLSFAKPIVVIDSIKGLSIANAKSLIEEQVKFRKHILDILANCATDKALVNTKRKTFINSSIEVSNIISSATMPFINYCPLSLSDYFHDIQLTTTQSSLIEALTEFFKDNSKKVFIIKGYAGTGKSFITNALVSFLKGQQIDVTFAAPTCKAAKILSQKSGHSAFSIHKGIYEAAKPKELNFDSDAKSLRLTQIYKIRNNIDSANQVYLFDEASMIGLAITNKKTNISYGSGSLLNDIMEYVDLNGPNMNRKIIFIGDLAQLPPVGEETSFALNKDFLEKIYHINATEFELKDVVRQEKNSGILNFATLMRNKIFSFDQRAFQFTSDYADTHLFTTGITPALIDTYFNYMPKKDSPLPMYRFKNTNAICISHTNARVIMLNKIIHNQIFPDQPTLCNNAKIMVYESNNTYGISNSEQGLVRNVSGSVIEKDVSFFNVATKRYEKITLKFQEVEILFTEKKISALILLNYFEHESKIDDAYLSKLKRALHVDFMNRFKLKYTPNERTTERFYAELCSDEFVNAFICRLGYAITIHKAQGSEWDNVFLDFYGLNGDNSQHRKKLIYTAITRAKNRLFVLNHNANSRAILNSKANDVSNESVDASEKCFDHSMFELLSNY